MSTNQVKERHWHLFIDDHVLARSTGFDRVVHQPNARGVVIPADKPWETAGVAPSHIGRRDDGSFYAYYTAMWWDIDGASKLPGNHRHDRAHHIFMRMAHAASKDGIHWQKPNLGLASAPAGVDRQKHWPYPGPVGSSQENNLGVPYIVVADLGQYGDVADPARRYALRLSPDQNGEAAGIGSNWRYAPRGYFAADLPDFRNDPDWQKKLVDAESNFNPRRNQLHYWDALHEEWVAIDQGVVPHWLPSREIARFGSGDLIHWHSQAVLYPDVLDPHTPERYDEPMGLVPFYAEGVVFGLLSWFHSDRTHPGGGPNLEVSAEHPYIWPYCRKGTNEMRITVSRDGGFTWDRTSSRQAWIPHGVQEDSYDRLVISPRPPVRVGDEDWFYMGVVDGDHLITRNNVAQTPYYHDRVAKHQIALYVQKHNRYVSLRAHNRPEILVTRPVQITGDSLHLNVDAARGCVRVGIAPAHPVETFEGTTPSNAPHLLPQHLLPGFSFDECEPIRANSIEHEVLFNGGAEVASRQGQQVCLLFEVMDADHYGFRI